VSGSTRFAIGAGYAVYRGPMTVGTLHRHAAFQIVIGIRDEVAVVDATDIQHRAAVLVVAPMVRHCLQATPDVLTYFVEPHCLFADRLRQHYGNGVTAAPELRDLSEDEVRPAGTRRSGEVDPRLVQALNALVDHHVSLPSLAAKVGLSPQRLRALARSQLGMPLARWRVWTRLDTTVSAESTPTESTNASPMPTRHCTAVPPAAFCRATASTSLSGSTPMICARGSTRLSNNAKDPVPQPTSTITSSGRGAAYMTASARHRRSRVNATTGS
jgi:hypothetical protein